MTTPDVELAIVGAGDLFEETRQLAESCAARDRIHLPGFDQPEKWLSWADCFVLPSRREGMSNALLEAMAAGLPCIANDIPPNREVLDNGNAGVLVPVEDCDALVAAMRDMAENEAKARRIAQAAKERAARCYSIEAVAHRYVALYQSLAPRHSLSPR
jgi:glycosyltransferase involved in cell wall biosynthesis